MPDDGQYDGRPEWEKERDALAPVKPRLDPEPAPRSDSDSRKMTATGTQADAVLLGYLGNNRHTDVEATARNDLLSDGQDPVDVGDNPEKSDREDQSDQTGLSAGLVNLRVGVERVDLERVVTVKDVVMEDAPAAIQDDRGNPQQVSGTVDIVQKNNKSPDRKDSSIDLPDHASPETLAASSPPQPMEPSLNTNTPHGLRIQDASVNPSQTINDAYYDRRDADSRYAAISRTSEYVRSYPSPPRPTSHTSPFPDFHSDPLSPTETLAQSPRIREHLRRPTVTDIPLPPIAEGAPSPSRRPPSSNHQRLPSIANIITTSNAFRSENRRRGQSMSALAAPSPWSPTPSSLGSPFSHTSPGFMQPSLNSLGPESPFTTSYPRRLSQITEASPRSSVPQSASTAYSAYSTASNVLTPASSVTEPYSPLDSHEYSTPPEHREYDVPPHYAPIEPAFSPELANGAYMPSQRALPSQMELRQHYGPPPINTQFVGTYHVPSAVNGVYRCDFPGCTAQAFQTQYLLNSHATVHSESRPHYCPIASCPRSKAGKGFKRKNEMIRHGLVHEPPKFVCPFCPDDREHRYPRPDNLQRHIKAHHKDIDKDHPKLKEVLAQKIGTTTLMTGGGSSTQAKLQRRKRVNSDVTVGGYSEAARPSSSDVRGMETMS